MKGDWLGESPMKKNVCDDSGTLKHWKGNGSAKAQWKKCQRWLWDLNFFLKKLKGEWLSESPMKKMSAMTLGLRKILKKVERGITQRKPHEKYVQGKFWDLENFWKSFKADVAISSLKFFKVLKADMAISSLNFFKVLKADVAISSLNFF